MGRFARPLTADLARESESKDRSILLVPRVQFVTLKLALPVLCCLGNEDHQDNCIRQMADEINKKRIRSKGLLPLANAMTSSPDTILRRLLTQLSPEWRDGDLKPETNPLFRGHDEGKRWRQVLSAFVANPTLAQLHDGSVTELGVSANFIAKEALRLYPSTCRICRQFVSEDGEVVEAAADVEASYRKEVVWGADASMFNPARWTFITEDEEKMRFLAFGATLFGLIARSAQPAAESRSMMPFGTAMIVLIVGGLIADICDGGWALTLGGTEERGELEAGSITPLQTGREAYAGLRVLRVD